MLKETLETFFTPTEQSLLFLYSALLGVGLSLVYDVFRVFRAIIPHTSFLVAFEDIVFCLIWGLALFVFSMESKILSITFINICREKGLKK